MKLISYLCSVKDNSEKLRVILYTDEFNEFYSALDGRAKMKFKENITILETIYVLSQKFVKKIENTDFYELRVSVGSNEYRTVIFALDHSNIIQSKSVILLNGFLKKDNKDYAKQVKKATTIYNNFQDEKD